MPRYKFPEYGQTTTAAINIQSQLIDGSFEHALNDLIDTLDLSAFDALYRNDLTGASARRIGAAPTATCARAISPTLRVPR